MEDRLLRGFGRFGCLVMVLLGLPFAAAGPAAARGPAHPPAFPPRTPSPWPSMRHDSRNTGAGAVPAVYRGDRPWSFATGRGLFITPVIGGDGAVYFGSADDNFYALNPNGTLRWRFATGNIIDAAAALSPSQRSVTIGSADENLYNLSTNPRRMPASRRVLWRYHATLAPATGQLVDWWEDNISYGPDGNIYTGNTGGVVYSFTPAGKLRWTFRAGNSVWTMPAFGPDGTTYWGSVDRSIFALGPGGTARWTTPTFGFVVSSPALGSDGTVYIGSFDSNLYALDPATGLPKWKFGTHDSIYSSPALGTDAAGHTNAIYVASTDGSLYKLSPSGKLIWSYDTGEPIRSSPVLGPGPRGGADQIVYVGSSDGSVYAIDAATGHRRWSYDTVSRTAILRDRHALNSSPALGRTGVYIGSEDGHLTYVPYDYCLHRRDPRCDTAPGEPYPANLSTVFPVTAGGTTAAGGTEGRVPTSSEITGRLMVRQNGATTYAAMLPTPSTASIVRTSPHFDATTELSGDGRYMFIVPKSFLAPSTTYHVTLAGTWGADGTRVADWTTPGTWTRFGHFTHTFTFRTAPAGGRLPLRVGSSRVTAFQLRRLAFPLPAFLPSVNQIGFDSYTLLVAPIAIGRPDASGTGSILLWATQARLGPHGSYVADPHGSLIFPLAGQYHGNTLKLEVQNAQLTFSFGRVPLQRLDFGFQLGSSLRAAPGASAYAQALCAAIPNYGPEANLTGICNEPDGVLAAAGTFITGPYAPAPHTGRRPGVAAANRRPQGLSVGSLTLTPPSPLGAGNLTATLALAKGVSYPAAEHRIGLLLVDEQTGQPLPLDYTDQVTTTDRHGNIATARLNLPAGTVLPAHVRAYVLADVFPLASRLVR
jgi:outer membrane protein assembly factor BamB